MPQSFIMMHPPLCLLFLKCNIPNLRCASGELLDRKDDWFLQDAPESPLRFTQAARYPAFSTAEQLQARVVVQRDVPMLRPDLQFILIAFSSSIKNALSTLKSLDFTWNMGSFTGPLGTGARGQDLQSLGSSTIDLVSILSKYIAYSSSSTCSNTVVRAAAP